MTASEGDATGSTTGSTTGDTTGSTTGDTTDATSGDTTGATTGDTTGNTTGEVWPLCAEPDPAIKTAYTFDLTNWDPEYDGVSYGQTVDVNAECTVMTVEKGEVNAEIDLTCSEGEKIDIVIGASLSFPPGTGFAVSEGEPVKLRYLGHGAEHHTSPGSQFALHEAGGDRLLIAGFSEMWGVAQWSQISAPIVVDRDTGVCPTECDQDECGEEEGVTREAFVFAAPMVEAVTVVDANRGTLTVGEDIYELIVGHAKWQECLNCFGTFQALISAQD